MKKYLCFDIGGLSLKYSVYDMNLVEYEKGKFEYDLLSRELIWQKIKDIYFETKIKYKDIAIAISSSGIINPNDNTVVGFEKKGKDFVLIEKNINDILNLKDVEIKIDNDARCALRAEMELGVAKEFDNVILYTVGTALGGSISINKKIITGNDFFAGEVGCGYFNFNDFGNISTRCGMYGLMESYKKGSDKKISGLQIYENAISGSKFELEIVNEQIFSIASVIVNNSLLVNPNLILIGGGISKNEWFINQLNQKVKEMCSKTMLKFNIFIKPATSFNESGKLGALMLYKQF